jgi:hypothetical protein
MAAYKQPAQNGIIVNGMIEIIKFNKGDKIRLFPVGIELHDQQQKSHSAWGGTLANVRRRWR